MVLSSLENTTVIALDDMDAIQGHPEWQKQFFIWLIYRKNTVIKLFCQSVACKALNFELRDLLSRLARAATFQLPTGSDRLDRPADFGIGITPSSLALWPAHHWLFAQWRSTPHRRDVGSVKRIAAIVFQHGTHPIKQSEQSQNSRCDEHHW